MGISSLLSEDRTYAVDEEVILLACIPKKRSVSKPAASSMLVSDPRKNCSADAKITSPSLIGGIDVDSKTCVNNGKEGEDEDLGLTEISTRQLNPWPIQ